MEWTFNAFGEDTLIIDYLRSSTREPGQTLREIVLAAMTARHAAGRHRHLRAEQAQVLDDWEYFMFPNVEIHTSLRLLGFPNPRTARPGVDRC